MAQKIQALFIDDIDGGEADDTVRFALDGAEYEIDLSTGHSDQLRDALREHIAHARKAGGSRRAARGGTAARHRRHRDRPVCGRQAFSLLTLASGWHPLRAAGGDRPTRFRVVR
jgi:hypothetical protein